MDALVGGDPAGAPIRAAGGVVGRAGEVLLVHRPRFDDWSLPKGKLKRGEHPLAGAVREVREETGVRGAPGIRLPTARYEVWDGDALAPKQVDYWAMSVVDEAAFEPSDEVDEIVWLPVPQARVLLTYPHDRRVLGAYGDLPSLHRPVVLLRHAHAGERDAWQGADAERPLDQVGEQQAAALAGLLALVDPRRLVSAQPLRCRQTLGALARALDLQVEVDPRFDEDADPAAAAAALRGLAGDTAVVVCSQGRIIPSAVALLSGRPAPDHMVGKGEGTWLSFSGARLVAADPFTSAVP